jgi:hypothetical protein
MYQLCQNDSNSLKFIFCLHRNHSDDDREIFLLTSRDFLDIGLFVSQIRKAAVLTVSPHTKKSILLPSLPKRLRPNVPQPNCEATVSGTLFALISVGITQIIS